MSLALTESSPAVRTSAHSDAPERPAHAAEAPTKLALWSGRILTGLAALFLAFDATLKILQPKEAIEGTTTLGYSASVIMPLGILQAALLALYLFPRTAVLGAILWTGYLGGAIATHVRVGNPLFSHVLFPIYVALFVWGGLWLRSPRLRAIMPVLRGDR